ncbi:MAG: hypothetical protein HN348_08695, partial [Proteobacteria bacterium]|nr:hypothetical protein [Pseudomonadota bacterium]
HTPVEVDGITDAEALWVGGSNLAATACVRQSDGLVKCWGQADLIPGGGKHSTTPTEVPSLRDVKEMALGAGHACAVQSDDGVACWGYGAFGSLGLGPDVKAKTVKEPQKVGLEGMTDVCAGNNHACALHQNGDVSCWGNNFSGQSDPTNPGYQKDLLVPKKVEGVSGATQLACGYDLSCVLVGDQVKCWGDGFRDKVGDLPDSTGTVSLWRNFSEHSCIVKTGGELWCWGKNTFGQAGASPETSKDLKKPQKVEGMSMVKSVATAHTSAHTCALSDMGDVYCWGHNRYGAIGDGTLYDDASPQPVHFVADESLPSSLIGDDKVKAQGQKTEFSDDLPDKCKVEDIEVAFTDMPSFKTFEVQYASAKIKENKSKDNKVGKTYAVSLRNYTYDPTLSNFDYDQWPRGDQVYVNLTFKRNKVTKKGDKEVKSARDVKPGKYWIGRASTEDRMEVSGNADFRYLKAWFSGGLLGKAYEGVELTFVSDDVICGNLMLQNKENVIKGSFVAPVVK